MCSVDAASPTYHQALLRSWMVLCRLAVHNLTTRTRGKARCDATTPPSSAAPAAAARPRIQFSQGSHCQLDIEDFFFHKVQYPQYKTRLLGFHNIHLSHKHNNVLLKQETVFSNVLQTFVQLAALAIWSTHRIRVIGQPYSNEYQTANENDRARQRIIAKQYNK